MTTSGFLGTFYLGYGSCGALLGHWEIASVMLPLALVFLAWSLGVRLGVRR